MFKFGSSWLGIIFNPVGYMAQRKSPEAAAREYITKNPTSLLIGLTDTELTLKEDSVRWIDGCASKLKSDDVGKSLANSKKACEGVFYSDGNVNNVLYAIQQKAEQEKAEVQAKLEEGVKTALMAVLAFLFIGAIIYLLTSK